MPASLSPPPPPPPPRFSMPSLRSVPVRPPFDGPSLGGGSSRGGGSAFGGGGGLHAVLSSTFRCPSSICRDLAFDSAYVATVPVGSLSRYMQKYFRASTSLPACWYSAPM